MAKSKAKVKKKRNAVPRSKQPYLHESMEPPSIPEINDAAEGYYETMRERVQLSADEHEAKMQLIDVMKKHGQTYYTTPGGLSVALTTSDGVKCKRRGDAVNVTDNGQE